MQKLEQILAEELGQKLEHVQNVIRLLDEGNTIPSLLATARKCMERWMTLHCVN